METPLTFTADIICEPRPELHSGADWLSNFAIHFDEHGVFFLLLLIIAPVLLVGRFIRRFITSGREWSPKTGVAEFGNTHFHFKLSGENPEDFQTCDILAIELHENAHSDAGPVSVILLTLNDGRRVHHRLKAESGHCQATLHRLVQIWRGSVGHIVHLRSGAEVPAWIQD